MSLVAFKCPHPWCRHYQEATVTEGQMTVQCAGCSALLARVSRTDGSWRTLASGRS